MQDECEMIYSAVLHNTLQGKSAKRQLDDGNTPFVGIIYGPERQVRNGK